MADEETVQVEDGASPVEEGTTAAIKRGRPKNMTEADFNRMFEARTQELVGKAQAPLQRANADLERQVKRANERADASWNYRDDPDAFNKWEEETRRKQVGEEYEGTIAELRRDNARLQMRATYPNVPDSAFADTVTPQDVEIAALKWERTNGAAPPSTSTEDDETPPEAPGVLVGGGASGSGLSDAVFRVQWGEGTLPS